MANRSPGEELDAIREQLYGIHSALRQLSDRLHNIEWRAAQSDESATQPAPTVDPSKSPPTSPLAASASTELPPIPDPRPPISSAPSPERRGQVAAAASAAPAATRNISPLPPIPKEPANSPQAARESLELLIGATWLNRIGAVVVLAAIGFFMKYSIDRGWIPPGARVLMGAALGLSMIGAGEWFILRGARNMAAGLVGAGVGTLYLSCFAAHSLFGLINNYAAFGGNVVITALAAVLAVQANIQGIAILAALGGFWTPIAIRSGQDRHFELFAYLVLLDVGLLAAAARRRWDRFPAVCWFGTVLLSVLWHQQHYQPELVYRVAAFVTVFWAIFYVDAVRRMLRALVPAPDDLSVLVHAVNASFVGAIWYVGRGPLEDWLGLYCLLLGGLQWGLAYRVQQRTPAAVGLLTALLVDGATILALAAPMHFDRAGVVIAWSVQSAATFVAARRFDVGWIWGKAFAVMMLALSHYVLWDYLDLRRDPPYWSWAGWFVNEALLLALIMAACAWIGAAALTLRRVCDGMQAQAAQALVVVGCVLLLGVLGDQFEPFHATGAWMLVFLAWWAAGRYVEKARDVAVVLLGAAAVKYFAFDLTNHLMDRTAPEISGFVLNRATAVGLAITVGAIVARRDALRLPGSGWLGVSPRGIATGLALLAAVAMLVTGSFESYRAFEVEEFRHHFANSRLAMQATFSVYWSVCAIVFLAIGLLRDLAPLRYLAIGLFGVTLGKVVLVDLSHLQLVYRIVSFFVLGILLLLASYLYQRAAERLRTQPPEAA